MAELDNLIADASRARDETRERRRKELRSKIEARLKAEGFTAHDVLGAKLKPKSDTLSPKYGDKTGRSWSGKGRVPGWLPERLDKGEPLERFAIAAGEKEKTG